MNTIKEFTLGLLLGTALLSWGALAEDDPKIMVYKSPTRGCCTKWVSHLQEKAFEAETTDLKDLRMIKCCSWAMTEAQQCLRSIDRWTLPSGLLPGPVFSAFSLRSVLQRAFAISAAARPCACPI